MGGEKSLKLFISYSHLDEEYVEVFNKHIFPLKNNGMIQEWHDRKIIAGQDFQNTIDNNLEKADIICLFISANFLSSKACLREKENAYRIQNSNFISVVPIILSYCGWLDDKELSPKLALPTDGKPISSFQDPNEGWNNVYYGLKKVIELENKMRKLTIKDSFSEFLDNAELLTKAHSEKETVKIEDIFTYPTLTRYDELGDFEKKENAENLINDFPSIPKILISGEEQSGKTTLCKKMYKELAKKGFIPVYIELKTSNYYENIKEKIQNCYNDQYHNISIEDINADRIVPILDNFHLFKQKERLINDLTEYTYQVIIVDDIFRMNFKDEKITKGYNLFIINELSPSQRYDLIKKWSHLTDKKNNIEHSENQLYKIYDQKTELVDAALGKVIGSGIMPAYPFFILSVISTYDTFQIPLDQEITSQGYCYQALIYLCLRKQKVKNDEVDTYLNFLTEFAFFLFTEKKNELSNDEFNNFMRVYEKRYHLPVKKELLLQTLHKGLLITLDSFGNYSFHYPYLYYYFVAKYISEHYEENKKLICEIINNLHKNENAYIAVFINHHSKNIFVLEEILLNAMTLFDKYKPATLTKNELNFFDEKLNYIIKEALPNPSNSPEQERYERLKKQENDNNDNMDDFEKDASESVKDMARDLRRSIKTVEVMGQIIKNRAGSLEKDKIKLIFEEGMNVHLRILSSFLDIIRNEEGQKEIIDYLSDKLIKIVEESAKKLDKTELDKISRTIFWNLNFSVVYGFIDKISKSLGSDKLISIVNEICEKQDTPASFLVKHSILMWYSKNLQTDNISLQLKRSEYSKISEKIMRFIIVDYASMHPLNWKDRQKIESKFHIPSNKLLLQNIKHKN